MCSKLTTKRPEDVKGFFIFNFIVNSTYSGVFNVNFEHISHLTRREKCQNTCLYWKKESKVSLADFKLKCFSFVHIYIHPGRINGILW